MEKPHQKENVLSMHIYLTLTFCLQIYSFLTYQNLVYSSKTLDKPNYIIKYNHRKS